MPNCARRLARTAIAARLRLGRGSGGLVGPSVGLALVASNALGDQKPKRKLHPVKCGVGKKQPRWRHSMRGLGALMGTHAANETETGETHRTTLRKTTLTLGGNMHALFFVLIEKAHFNPIRVITASGRVRAQFSVCVCGRRCIGGMGRERTVARKRAFAFLEATRYGTTEYDNGAPPPRGSWAASYARNSFTKKGREGGHLETRESSTSPIP